MIFRLVSEEIAQHIGKMIVFFLVEIGGSNYTAENPSINGTKVSWTFTDELYVSKTSDIRVLANIYATGDKANTITFDSIRGASFTK
jgi:hypothetical protein